MTQEAVWSIRIVKGRIQNDTKQQILSKKPDEDLALALIITERAAFVLVCCDFNFASSSW
jgi:hypothetical protein